MIGRKPVRCRRRYNRSRDDLCENEAGRDGRRHNGARTENKISLKLKLIEIGTNLKQSDKLLDEQKQNDTAEC